MKIILLQDIKSVGKKGDIIDANDGYARNFLIPKKMGWLRYVALWPDEAGWSD